MHSANLVNLSKPLILSSFRWGFSRVRRGSEVGSYYHKFFQRGNYKLARMISCKTIESSPILNSSPSKKSSMSLSLHDLPLQFKNNSTNESSNLFQVGVEHGLQRNRAIQQPNEKAFQLQQHPLFLIPKINSLTTQNQLLEKQLQMYREVLARRLNRPHITKPSA